MNIVTLNLCVTYTKCGQGCVPTLEIRKVIRDPEIIKEILSAAFHDETITAVPNFTNKVKALATLQEKGIIYYNEKEKKYLFII